MYSLCLTFLCSVKSRCLWTNFFPSRKLHLCRNFLLSRSSNEEFVLRSIRANHSTMGEKELEITEIDEAGNIIATYIQSSSNDDGRSRVDVIVRFLQKAS